MSTPRRPRPNPGPQPGRRPKVAGLRRPGEQPSPRPRSEQDEAEADEARLHETESEAQDAPASQDVAADERESAADDVADDSAATDADAATADAATTDADAADADAQEPGESTAAATGRGAHAAESGPDADAETPATAARPSPRAKARDTGRPKPETPEELTDSTEDGGDGGDRGRTSEGDVYRLTPVLAAIALVLLLLAGFFAFKWISASSSANNMALADAPATADVKQQVTEAVETLFSFDYKNIGKTEQAAKDLLANDEVRGTYDCLYGEVKRLAPEQKMILTTRVARIAPISLQDEDAELLVFVDQAAVRSGKDKSNYGGSQLTVSAEQVDGKWKIAEIDAYDAKKTKCQPGGK